MSTYDTGTRVIVDNLLQSEAVVESNDGHTVKVRFLSGAVARYLPSSLRVAS